jgi:tetratricopeptide (TPR) repeat protein
MSHQPPELSVETPELVLHDTSFSLMVNFHALGEYVKARGGSVVHQPALQWINTSVFYLGGSFDRLAETKTALSTFLLDFSPGDLAAVFDQAKAFVPDAPPGTLLAFLSLSQWDPAYVNACIDQIVALARTAEPVTCRCLADGMQWCVEQFYALPGADSTLANAGIVFQELQDYPAALDLYQRSLELWGSEPQDRYVNTLYNMGLCHYRLGEREAALEAFRRADAAAPRDDMMTKGWIYHLTVEAPVSGEPQTGTGVRPLSISGILDPISKP